MPSRDHIALLITIAVAVGLFVAVRYVGLLSQPRECHIVVMEQRVRDCMAKGQLDEALKNANLLVERFGDDSSTAHEAHYIRARVHARRNDADSAVRDLTVAIDSCSRSELTRLYSTVARGRCYEHYGMLEAAAEDYGAVYEALLEKYEDHNQSNRTDPCNYMDVIQFFWSSRQYADEDFGFGQLEFEQHESYRETKRARQEAVLKWLVEYVDVHPKIIANTHNVDAKVFSLE